LFPVTFSFHATHVEKFFLSSVLRPKDENQPNLVTVQATEEGFKAMLRWAYYGEFFIDPVPGKKFFFFFSRNLKKKLQHASYSLFAKIGV
jgi:hypothetical protein